MTSFTVGLNNKEKSLRCIYLCKYLIFLLLKQVECTAAAVCAQALLHTGSPGRSDKPASQPGLSNEPTVGLLLVLQTGRSMGSPCHKFP